MKTLIPYLWLVPILAFEANAQPALPQVLNSTGKSVSNSSYTIEYAVGDWVSTYARAGSYETNSGVIQGSFILTVINTSVTNYRPTMTVYPNPTPGTLHISEMPEGTSSIGISDNLGMELKRYVPGLELRFPEIPSGTYLLHFRDSKNNILSSIKIVKN